MKVGGKIKSGLKKAEIVIGVKRNSGQMRAAILTTERREARFYKIEELEFSKFWEGHREKKKQTYPKRFPILRAAVHYS